MHHWPIFWTLQETIVSLSEDRVPFFIKFRKRMFVPFFPLVYLTFLQLVPLWNIALDLFRAVLLFSPSYQIFLQRLLLCTFHFLHVPINLFSFYPFIALFNFVNCLLDFFILWYRCRTSWRSNWDWAVTVPSWINFAKFLYFLFF